VTHVSTLISVSSPWHVQNFYSSGNKALIGNHLIRIKDTAVIHSDFSNMIFHFVAWGTHFQFLKRVTKGGSRNIKIPMLNLYI